MGDRVRVLGSFAAAALLTTGLVSCSSPVNTDDPSAVAAGMLNALAQSDCKQVLELYPTATADEDFPAEGCNNEMAGKRAIGVYTCAPEQGAEQSATHANIRCTSAQDAETVWGAGVAKATEGWQVTAVSAL